MKAVRSKRKAAVFLVTLGGMLAVVPSVAFAYPECGHLTVARDYLAQVKRAAPIKELPELGDPMSKQLPFAPPGLRLQAVGSGLIVESSQVGFSLSSPFRTLRRLEWIVESELLKVSARGRVIQSFGIKRRSIESVQDYAAINFMHRVSATPAYYRADIRIFRKGTNRILDRYSSYARVMKPRVDLRVKIDTFAVAPGEFARATLLNLGTVPLVTPSYDYGFGVQAFTGEGWINVPDNPRRRIPKRTGPWTLSAGLADRGCLRYLVPNDQAPGLFRFAGYGATGTLAAEFQVEPGP
jgi:hypothetical protein